MCTCLKGIDVHVTFRRTLCSLCSMLKRLRVERAVARISSVALCHFGESAPHTPDRRVFSTSKKNDIWRTEDQQKSNPPSVTRRDGTVGMIDKHRGFIDYSRKTDSLRDPLERVRDWQEINSVGHNQLERTVQAARCMDCGTPFCQTHTGCPLNNLIPQFNDLVYQGQWREAADRLHKVRKVTLNQFGQSKGAHHLECTNRQITSQNLLGAFVRPHAKVLAWQGLLMHR